MPLSGLVSNDISLSLSIGLPSSLPSLASGVERKVGGIVAPTSGPLGAHAPGSNPSRSHRLHCLQSPARVAWDWEHQTDNITMLLEGII